RNVTGVQTCALPICCEAGSLPSQSPNGASSPRGGAKYVRRQKLAQSQVSPPPLGGAGAQWAPFSADRAGRRECPPKEGGEGEARAEERRGGKGGGGR